jgi:hypothetical protein
MLSPPGNVSVMPMGISLHCDGSDDAAKPAPLICRSRP